MKKHFFVYLVFVSSVIIGQENDTTILSIPHHATIIYVKNVSFKAIVGQLIENGYKVDELIENIIVITKYKELGQSLYKMRFLIRYSEGAAQINADIYDAVWAFRNPRKTRRVVAYGRYAFIKPFDVMNNFALSLNGTVSYEK